MCKYLSRIWYSNYNKPEITTWRCFEVFMLNSLSIVPYTCSKATHNRMWPKGKTVMVHLLCLYMVPFCGFNTQPHHCALVSPVIPSNLATLNWILCLSSSVLWERLSLFNTQKTYSGACGNLERSRPQANGDWAGNISLSLSHGVKVNTPGGWLPFLPTCCCSLPTLIHFSKCALLHHRRILQ